MTFLQITPAFVREAYSLLKQSIIHIEQDDVDVEEIDADEPMQSNSEHEPDEAGSNPAQVQAETPQPGSTSNTNDVHTGQQQPQAKQKQKMKISHDEYATIQSMIVLHLGAHERLTGRGIDRDELIDWYLEQKEEDMHDVEALEYQSELIKKVLKKLVKVGSI